VAWGRNFLVVLSGLVLVLGSCPSLLASPVSALGSDSWTLVSTPSFCPFVSGYRSFCATYINNLNETQEAIAFMVVHNPLGQTIEFSSAMITIAPAASGMTVLILFGISPGDYNASFFVTTPGIVALSTTSTTAFSISSP
jgi:hypothetical protein